MKYEILIRHQIQKKLQTLAQDEKNRIVEKIYWLGQNPNDKRLRIKVLEGQKGYFRLRVGSWRILFSKNEHIKIVYIEKLKPHGDAYK